MEILQLLREAVDRKASDLHITVNVPPTIRLNGELEELPHKVLLPENTLDLVKQTLSEKQFKKLVEIGELDLSFSNPGIGRYRVNAYRQRGTYGMAIRVVNLEIPTIEQLGLPVTVKELARKKRGLILVTGPTGSGKSTSLAAMINLINMERRCHILTLEDPIEYLLHHKRSIVIQREVGGDTTSFAKGLRAALREDPDVILVGEMRDLETIQTAITAAETGHLVMSTLHTQGSASTIDRIIDVFPPHQQQQIRIQLAGTLQGIISQQLLPKDDESGRVGAYEVMIATPAIKNMIREGKTHQIQSVLQTGSKFGMQTMDNCLLDLFKRGIISREDTMSFSFDYERMMKMLSQQII